MNSKLVLQINGQITDNVNKQSYWAIYAFVRIDDQFIPVQILFTYIFAYNKNIYHNTLNYARRTISVYID